MISMVTFHFCLIFISIGRLSSVLVHSVGWSPTKVRSRAVLFASQGGRGREGRGYYPKGR
ncbi:hypothetical protein KC19_VG161100 [Ceratodon purpureus]|uniref:Secreted protein n=1 Tax=Ceratodon purpureus TaxID=3225 RepID=A0A8T0HQJ2_CERPU|nr:hypothetical protein KC19_VG161100 [Ceratodon purpureus]